MAQKRFTIEYGGNATDWHWRKLRYFIDQTLKLRIVKEEELPVEVPISKVSVKSEVVEPGIPEQPEAPEPRYVTSDTVPAGAVPAAETTETEAPEQPDIV